MLTSTANPRVKELVRLRRRRTRDERALCLLEGHDELSLALTAGARPAELFYAPELIGPEPPLLARVRAAGAQLTPVSRDVFAKIAYRESPDGWLAVLPTPAGTLAELELGPDPLLLVCEGIEKPGNLGAMLRTAEAAGVSAVISASPVTDFGNPNVIRASKGTVFSVPLASAASADVLDWLAATGVRAVVATPRAGSMLAEADLTGPVALVVGSESSGVSGQWLAPPNCPVAIPMLGRVNSLNAAAAAAVALYEANRQRGAAAIIGQPG